MDLRAYYQKLRAVESGLTGPFVVLFSLDTPDGGKAGVITEAAKYNAAKQLLEGRARVATTAEAEAFHQANHDARQAAEQAAVVSRMQFVVVPAKLPVKGSKE